MDAVVLTWRWQNILSIWLMVIALFLLVTVGSQFLMRAEGKKAATNG
jgi:hypothetical protein